MSIWSYEERVTKPIALLKEKYPSTQFIEITSDKEVEALLGYYLNFSWKN